MSTQIAIKTDGDLKKLFSQKAKEDLLSLSCAIKLLMKSYVRGQISFILIYIFK